MGIEDSPAGPGNVQEGQSMIEKRLDCDFIGGIEHGPGRSAALGDLETEIECRKCRSIRGFKMKRGQFAPVQSAGGAGESLRVREGVLNG